MTSVYGGPYATLLDLIVSFKYYDGPESGLALYKSAPALRFESIGDSSSRIFRAFEISCIEGDWWTKANHLPDVAKKAAGTGPVMIFQRASEELTALIGDVEAASPTASYIGVGCASMEWLKVSPVSGPELSALHGQLGWLDRYRAAHEFIKHSSSVGSLRSILSSAT
jgi:hypothetical protein